MLQLTRRSGRLVARWTDLRRTSEVVVGVAACTPMCHVDSPGWMGWRSVPSIMLRPSRLRHRWLGLMATCTWHRPRPNSLQLAMLSETQELGSFHLALGSRHAQLPQGTERAEHGGAWHAK